MKTTKCVIIDDEQPARELLENYISKVPTLEITGKFKNPLDALTLINDGEADLVFIDIQMPEMKGTDFVKSIIKGPEIIFTTAYPDYALEGFELEVTDYLLKPFGFDRFMKAVNRAIDNLNARDHLSSDFIKISADHRIYRVAKSDILYIEGLKEYVSYFTVHGERIIALKSMKSLEKELGSSGFLRVHRSYIIRIDKVKFIEGNSIAIGEKRIPIGRSYRDNVLRLLG